jgi:hypothetical protein
MQTALIIKGKELDIRYTYNVVDKDTGDFELDVIKVYSTRQKQYVTASPKLDSLLADSLYQDDSVSDAVAQDVVESAIANREFWEDCKREDAMLNSEG